MVKDIFYWTRTLIFYITAIVFGVPWCTFIILTVYLIPERKRHAFFVTTFCWGIINLARVICGVRWRVEGEENIPGQACVVASNHQSAWETLFLQMLISPQSTVLKKELFMIPFFGWALKRLNPIAIDRKDRRSAMQQVKEKGKARLDDNYWVMIFPEGTRLPWPQIGTLTRGTATLAKYAEVPILPIVHNAGRFWPSFSWKKTPGEIVVRIGQPMPTNIRDVNELTSDLQEWMQANHP